MSLTLALAFLLGGVVLLFAGAEALVHGSVKLGVRFRMSPALVGITMVSLGTSLPELVVCLMAAVRGSPDLAVGNVLGSNMANVGLILGFTALLRPLRMTRPMLRRELPLMLLVTVILFPILVDGWIARWEGAVLLGILVAYLALLARAIGRGANQGDGGLAELPGDLPVPLPKEVVQKGSPSARAEPDESGEASRPALGGNLLLAAGGSVLLVLGGHGIVEGAVELGAAFGISDLLMGLSVLALGTSLPELATSVVAALKGETEIAVGNVVGSNLFNLTLVLGGTALVSPIAVAPHVLRAEYPVVLALSLLIIPVAWTGRRMVRGEGLLLLAAYGLCWAWILSV